MNGQADMMDATDSGPVIARVQLVNLCPPSDCLASIDLQACLLE